MSLSHIRNRIEALERRLALPLAVVTLRPLVEEFCEQWHVAAVDSKPLPDSHSLARKISEKGLFLDTITFLHKHIGRHCEKREEPDPQGIAQVLLPSAWKKSLIWNVFQFDALPAA